MAPIAAITQEFLVHNDWQSVCFQLSPSKQSEVYTDWTWNVYLEPLTTFLLDRMLIARPAD